MEDVKALFRVCRHIKTNGARCGSPAMKGLNFCFNHIGGKPAAFVREKTTTTYETNLNLVHPGTREAIQHNLALIAAALNEGKLDAGTANSYIRLYRIAEQNLTRWEKANKDNPDKQMLPLATEETMTVGAPCLEETWDRDASITSSSGDPHHRSLSGELSPLPLSLSPRTVVIPSEASNTGVPTDRSSSVGWSSEVEEPASPPPATTPGAGAPCLAETWDPKGSDSGELSPLPSSLSPSILCLTPSLAEKWDKNISQEQFEDYKAEAAKHMALTGRPLEEHDLEYFRLIPPTPDFD